MIANVLDLFHGDNREMLPDFAAIKALGIFAIIHKATQGTVRHDPRYAARIAAARDAGLLVGAYHFGTSANPDDQADFFLSVVKPKHGDFVALDFEHNPAGGTMTVQSALHFLDCLESEGLFPVVYGSDLPRENARTLCSEKMRYLWLAEYGPHEIVPAPWSKSTTLLWQFSGSGNISHMNGHVDLNYFDGTLEQLQSKWGKQCLSGV